MVELKACKTNLILLSTRGTAGEQRKNTVDNRFFKAKSPKQQARRAETCIGEVLRLCDGTGMRVRL